MSQTPQGWHPDPHDPSQLRWWDGVQWTSHTHPVPGGHDGVQEPARESHGDAQSVSDSGSSDRDGGSSRGSRFAASKPKLFGKGQALDEAHGEIRRLQDELERLGAMDIADLDAERTRLRAEVAEIEQQRLAARAAAAAEQAAARDELATLRGSVVETRETLILQEVGVYRYQHPLDDSVAYRAELARLQEQIKAMVKKEGGAITATTTWEVNGSAAKGKKMVNDISKLMLRAYNAEADNQVRALKPYKLASAKDRLEKVAWVCCTNR